VVLVVGLTPTEDSIFSQLKVGKSEDGFLLEKHPKLGPVEVSSAGIYLCGSAQAPKDVRDSISQAMGAAGKAGMLLSRGKIEKEPITAKIDAELCNGCGLCVKVCPFSAINMVPMEGKPRPIAVVTTAACMGCGTCSAECQVKFAIEMPYFTDSQIKAQIDAALAERPDEKVVTFACNWCSYAGADQAGVEKLQYPPSSRVIRTMCSGRISYSHIAYAFEKGAGAVLVTGCRIGDCHYINANLQTEKRFAKWSQRIQNSLKIPPERLHLRWISAAEGKEFAAKMKEMDQIVKKNKAQKAAAAGVAQ
jgi:heterodisulfide reductase subunit A